jgi:heat shock protein HslJ
MTRPFALLMLSLALIACTQAPAPPDKPAQTSQEPSHSKKERSGNHRIDQYEWRLQNATDAQGRRIDALLIRQDQPIQFNFIDGRIAIHNACNGISGDIRIDGNTLRVDGLVSTKMACTDPTIMALDSEVAARLKGEVQFELSNSDPPKLVWTAANGDTLRFIGAPTPETMFRSPGEIAYLEVAARSEPCPPSNADASQRCLRIRELRYDTQGVKITPPGEWQLFRASIKGYTHEEGIRTVLRVKRFIPDDRPPVTDTHAMPDAAYAVYILDMAIESEIVAP